MRVQQHSDGTQQGGQVHPLLDLRHVHEVEQGWDDVQAVGERLQHAELLVQLVHLFYYWGWVRVDGCG